MDESISESKRSSNGFALRLPALSGRRDRSLERRAQRVVEAVADDSCGSDGLPDPQAVTETLRRSLELVDPEYKRARQAYAVVGSLRRGLARQGKDKVSSGVKRALVDIVVSGAASGTYSVASGCALLGVSSRGKLTNPDERRSTADSFLRPRKRLKQGFKISVEKAVREFALCYCKYEEKTYVSVLCANAVWAIYCLYHDKQGRFYSTGNNVHRVC